MKTIIIGTFAFILMLGIFLFAWYRYLRMRYRRIIGERCKIVALLADRLARREIISRADVEIMARNAALRHAVYSMLEAYGRLELFPEDLLTIEKSAESFLIMWLEFPTELGELPDEIEFYTTVAVDGILSLTYYVFRYRMHSKHWAAQYNWMFGVVGPYGEQSKPYDIPAKIFSRFSTIHTTTAAKEVRWVHENIR